MNHEQQGTGYDPGARGHELLGRKALPDVMKVVGVGLPRTGTKTLRHCLEHFGLRCWSGSIYQTLGFLVNREAVIPHVETERLIEQMGQFDGFEDWPWPLLFEEFERRYPGARFVLTLRRDAETWSRSVKWHYDQDIATEQIRRVDRQIWTRATGAWPPPLWFYEMHMKKVFAHFSTPKMKKRLLVVCWESGDGWAELAKFLGFEVPDLPFPHIHKGG